MPSETKNKHDLPILSPDDDLLEKFEKSSGTRENCSQNPAAGRQTREKLPLNKHGVPVLDSGIHDNDIHKDSGEKEFETLLKDYLKAGRTGQKRGQKPSMPLKKRLKRYPPVERELDLHGYNAINAGMRAESFITTCKYQGYFTIRIITGRGLHSESGPVLPDIVEDVVCAMKKNNMVLSYQWEKKKKSASGAIIVYLKQFERFD
jgi:DNA-nicking Smr family endonuclease